MEPSRPYGLSSGKNPTAMILFTLVRLLIGELSHFHQFKRLIYKGFPSYCGINPNVKILKCFSLTVLFLCA